MRTIERSNPSLLISALFGAGAIGVSTFDASAQRLIDDLPQIRDVGIEFKIGAEIPRDLVFEDAQGRSLTTADWFDGERPVILVMAYYDCPLLCTLIHNRVQQSLNSLKWAAGGEFRVVTVSFDFRDEAEDARKKQELYHLGYNRDPGDDGWMFLTGTTENIRALTKTVGYNYRYLPENAEFSHPSALIFLTPTGEVHNYIERLEFPSAEVKLALMEAASGEIGTIFDRVAHFCFRYDPKTGQYSPQVMNIMRVGATLGAVALAVFIGGLFWSRSRRDGGGGGIPRFGAENGGLAG